MILIKSPTVNEALVTGLKVLLKHGYEEVSRNGKALVAPQTVTNEYLYPNMRLLFSEERDANPFFHLIEAMWMLAGRKDIAILKRFAANIASYSVDGETMHAAYGYRWIHHFGVDQIIEVIKKLRSQPNTRQAVLQIWSPEDDLVNSQENSKDRACNLSVVFTARPIPGMPEDSKNYMLDMQVFNRSNDAIWGCYGANYVHFSFLMSFVAELSGMSLGTYSQISSNFHMYSRELYGEKLYDALIEVSHDEGSPNLGLKPAFSAMLEDENSQPIGAESNHYLRGLFFLGNTFFPSDLDLSESEVQAIVQGFQYEVNLVLDHCAATDGEALDSSSPIGIDHPFLLNVVLPMIDAHHSFKKKEYDRALSILETADAYLLDHHSDELFSIKPEYKKDTGSPCKYDWFHAAWLWVNRRKQAHLSSVQTPKKQPG